MPLTKKPLPPAAEKQLGFVHSALAEHRAHQHLFLITGAGLTSDEADALVLLGDVVTGAERNASQRPSDEWRLAQHALALRALETTAEAFCYRHAVDPRAELWRD